MDASFAQSLVWVLQSEGGNDDDPDDPGGRTSRGITQREYDAYRQLNGYPTQDVWSATQVEIDAIYRKSYWQPYCAKLPFGVDYVFFDENVNAGLHEAALVLQRALDVTADGQIGVVTLNACKNANPGALIDAMAQQRISVYKAIEAEHPVLGKYNKGWMSRVETCRVNAHTLVPK